NKLKKILSNYEVADYGGEWDMYCTGEFIDHNKTIIMTTDKTNGYYDILIKNKIKATKSYENENGDCDTTEEINRSKTTLKFNGEEYRENGSFAPIDVYLTDPDVNGTNVRQEPNGKIILKLKDDYFTLTITEAREGWFKLKKIIGVEGNNIEIPGGAAWVHHSVIGVSTRRKIKLLDKPKDGRVVGTIDQEIGVQVKDKYLDWVQVEYKGLIGWIASEWLCGNPVTTCP
ncbi:MAG: hypothetical protein AB8F74_19600, partial [Saprospiraceae bacterium]